MIVVTGLQSFERAVVTDDDGSHVFSDAGLPGIIFAHVVSRAPLAVRDFVGMAR